MPKHTHIRTHIPHRTQPQMQTNVQTDTNTFLTHKHNYTPTDKHTQTYKTANKYIYWPTQNHQYVYTYACLYIKYCQIAKLLKHINFSDKKIIIIRMKETNQQTNNKIKQDCKKKRKEKVN